MLHIAYLLHGYTSKERDLEGVETSITQIQVNYQTKEST